MSSANSNGFACGFFPLILSRLFISLPFALEINNEKAVWKVPYYSWVWNLTQFPGNQNDEKYAVTGYIFLTVFKQ